LICAFQCSSASRKFLNPYIHVFPALEGVNVSVLFSEPKIPQSRRQQRFVPVPAPFQCSSASRKFLNPGLSDAYLYKNVRFSALQRAENSSIH